MSYERQKIDCNCNDCIFMVRDMDKYNRINEARAISNQRDAERMRSHFHAQARKEYTAAGKAQENCDKERTKRHSLRAANFDRLCREVEVKEVVKSPIHFGRCSKKDIDVSFIPNTCQLDTQDCFLHRKDAK